MALFGRGSARRVEELEAQLAESQNRLSIVTSQMSALGGGPILEMNVVAETMQRHIGSLHQQADELQGQLTQLDQQRAQLLEQIQAARVQLGEATDRVAEASFGLYSYPHPADDSVQLKAELDAVRTTIKRLVREGSAYTTMTSFTFNGSSAQGSRFMRDMAKLMLRSYNAEAENALLKAKAGNLTASVDRLSRARDAVEKLGSMIDLRITEEYHRARISELELAVKHLHAKQVEREEEREQRRRLREEQRAQAEFEAEKARLEKERAHYKNVLARLRNGAPAEYEAIHERLAQIDQSIADVDARAANIRAGYVYVISNLGAFGPGMVKIGMTRRLEPMDRVKELGDASVPFNFDVHALFFSDDAVGVEAELHRRFANQRVNLINQRREFFYATPIEVRKELESIHGNLLEFREEPEAEQFRLSLAQSDRESPGETARRGM